MKKTIVLLALILSAISFSQEQEIDSLNTDKNTKVASFEVIEHVPVYKGCDDSMSNIELKNCMANSIYKHIAKNFNTSISNGLGIPDGKVRINVIFKINREGNIVDVIGKAPHPVLEEEAIRVIKLLPKMDKPAYQRGNPVTVPYSLPIIFNVVNPKKVAKPRK
ncbi:energy transducer TonB [Mariniflexile sp. HNIBRBA6329]|uniref:energy transducer TonB n=1 Tax=Mariniflexile sp. HNIBRBA6329 TaxID=3373088 RepID=UPI0037453332